MSLYGAARPLLFQLPAETAHSLGKRALSAAGSRPAARRLLARRYRYRHPALRTEAFGVEFPTPVGVAAGFDKNAEATRALAALGFGFVEVGTVTPAPQSGNPRPRLFRLAEDRGLINRLGFNGQGVDRVRERLDRRGTPDVPVGVNVGKMNDSGPEAAVEDYRRVFERLAPHLDYAVVNLSCPNTPDAFDEGSPEHVRAVLAALEEANDDDRPILVKVGPDEGREALADLVEIADSFDVAGYVATNTTTRREGLDSHHAAEWGGLSGKPLEPAATRTVRTLAGLTDRTIVGVGGVDSAESAYRKIRAGASLVQLYTGLVYRGPAVARAIARGLVELLERDGFESVAAAVGTAPDRPAGADEGPRDRRTTDR